MAASGQRLSDYLWKTIQGSVPIACVDVLPYRMLPDGTAQLGLILRHTPSQGERWCIVGGRLLLDESVSDAVHRELADAFVGGLDLVSTELPAPLVVEFFRNQRSGFPVDTRQHALSLTHVLQVSDHSPQVQGPEARDFRWFTLAELEAGPASELMGFGQEVLLERFAHEIWRQQEQSAS